jgi:hypothetical protein
VKVNVDTQNENKKAKLDKCLDFGCKILNLMLDLVTNTPDLESKFQYLDALEDHVSNVDSYEYEALDHLLVRIEKKIEEWKNVGDTKTHFVVLRRLLRIFQEVKQKYNLTEGKTSRGSIIFYLEFADRRSFLRFAKDMKEGQMKTTLSEIVIFEPLLEQLKYDLEKKDCTFFIEDIQEKTKFDGEHFVTDKE